MMNVSDMADEIADSADLTKTQARNAVNAVFETIQKALSDGQEVKLGSVGKLVVKLDKARTTRPFGGKPVEVPERRAVRFKAFKGMKDYLNPAKPERRRA